jgi:hypothetical protein
MFRRSLVRLDLFCFETRENVVARDRPENVARSEQSTLFLQERQHCGSRMDPVAPA